ncbi:MAG: type VI secretion system-associated FHA domain protein TagH, partial [Desulfobacterales bacterium]
GGNRRQPVSDNVLIEKPDPAARKTLRRSLQPADSELFKVFLQAAGIKDASFWRDEEIPELMGTIGAVFREMLAGLMVILRGRAELKAQLRVSATILGPANNNPLKFSPLVDDALKLLLTRNHPGFVNAVDAVREACTDIMNHQLAMTAGIQASLIKLLERFDPQHFAKQYQEGLVFQRKAKSWDAYSQAFRKIADEVLENIFGEDFVRAYEEQIAKLRAKQNKI